MSHDSDKGRKGHVNRTHMCNLVKVDPSSGRLSNAKLAESSELIISTVTNRLYTCSNSNFISADIALEIKQTKSHFVPTLRSDRAKTSAPLA